MNLRRLTTDILILGSGGAGLLAALHAHQANPRLDITVAVKGLLGKSGACSSLHCSLMPRRWISADQRK